MVSLSAQSYFIYIIFFQCVQYVDGEVLVELVPRLTDLIKSGIGIGTKVNIINQYYIKRFLHERNKTNLLLLYIYKPSQLEKLNFLSFTDYFC